MIRTLPKARRFTAVLLLASFLIMGTAFSSSVGTDPFYRMENLFTDRDLDQEADLSKAVTLALTDGSDIRINKAGVYILSGTASDVTVRVEAGEKDKVQLVLDGARISNSDFPCIYITSAGKTFITVSSDSFLAVTEPFRTDGNTNTDGVIFSRQDLVLSGTAVLTISSPKNGIVCKDDLKVTGGTYIVQASSKAFEANDSIRISGGVFDLSAGTDGFHAENKKDGSKGYIYISNGDFTIRAGDDGLHAVSVLQIDGGAFRINAGEGLEATVVQINGGMIQIDASDDGINAALKSASFTPSVIINGGETSITMVPGNVDGVDSNGNICMNGGTLTVTAGSPFHYTGTAEHNGGAIIANGEEMNGFPD